MIWDYGACGEGLAVSYVQKKTAGKFRNCHQIQELLKVLSSKKKHSFMWCTC